MNSKVAVFPKNNFKNLSESLNPIRYNRNKTK